jgi:hypothetical protein
MLSMDTDKIIEDTNTNSQVRTLCNAGFVSWKCMNIWSRATIAILQIC